MATPANLVRFAHTAEALGFDTIWTSDHIVVPTEVQSFYPYHPAGQMPFVPTEAYLEPLIVMTYLAAGSCTPTLRIIPSTQKPGKMPHLNPFWRGYCHGLASCLLPTRSVGAHLALCHVASHWVQPRSAHPTCAGPAQAQAVHGAQSVRGLDAQASLCPV